MNTSYQLYSSRNFGPLPETLSMLAELDYTGVEGYGDLFQGQEDAEKLVADLTASGLKMPTAHIGLDMVESSPSTVVEVAREIGIETVFVPFLAPDERPADAAGWRSLGERVELACAPLFDAGLTCGWHNHDFEFIAGPGGELPVEALLDGGPRLGLEFDVAWCVRAGQDPFEWISRLSTKIFAAHIKDIAPAGANLDEDGWVDVGQGIMDWSGLIKALQDTDCGHFIVEHDNPSDDRRFAATSLDFMTQF